MRSPTSSAARSPTYLPASVINCPRITLPVANVCQELKIVL